MRLEPDRRHLTLPVIGKLRSKENTRRLEWLIVNGRARILSMTLSQRGDRLARQISRRTVGSRAHRHAKTKRAALDRRAANLRRQAIHVLTTRLARRYATVVEDLDVAAMQRTMGRRAFRRTVSQAGIGRVRPTLAYKCPAMGGALVVADRWFGSSKSHWLRRLPG
jgi:putative transposase